MIVFFEIWCIASAIITCVAITTCVVIMVGMNLRDQKTKR
jgi:hypothetical protein